MVVDGVDEERGIACLKEDGHGEGVRATHPDPPIVGHIVDLTFLSLLQVELRHLQRKISKFSSILPTPSKWNYQHTLLMQINCQSD